MGWCSPRPEVEGHRGKDHALPRGGLTRIVPPPPWPGASRRAAGPRGPPASAARAARSGSSSPGAAARPPRGAAGCAGAVAANDHVARLLPPHDAVARAGLLDHTVRSVHALHTKMRRFGMREHAVDLARQVLAAAVGHQAEPLEDRLLVRQAELLPHGRRDLVELLGVGHAPQVAAA